MGIEESDRRGDVFRVLEFLHSLLEFDDCLAKNLGAGLALSIVVLTAICFLGTGALLTRRSRTITAHLAFPVVGWG